MEDWTIKMSKDIYWLGCVEILFKNEYGLDKDDWLHRLEDGDTDRYDPKDYVKYMADKFDMVRLNSAKINCFTNLEDVLSHYLDDEDEFYEVERWIDMHQDSVGASTSDDLP